MWIKILISCVPAAVVGLLFDDQINDLFYNSVTVAIMLIVVGVAFILVEQHNKHTQAKVTTLSGITYSLAFAIGMFQPIAAVFPGTSRSGATILGALLLGIGKKSSGRVYICAGHTGDVRRILVACGKIWIVVYRIGIFDFACWYDCCICRVADMYSFSYGLYQKTRF